MPGPLPPSPSILYQSQDSNILLLDIPLSIASSIPGHTLLSTEPLSEPYILPEPKDPTLVFNQELLDTHNRLKHSLVTALEQIRTAHNGDWCRPRHITQQPNYAAEKEPLVSRQMKENLGMLQTSSDEPLELSELEPHSHLEILDVYNNIVSNSDQSSRVISVVGTDERTHTFLIPATSSFLMAPFSSSIPLFNTHATRIGGFDFVLLDPPWPNRSAQRSNAAYDTLENPRELLRIPLKPHIRPGGIIGVWVTNKPRWRRFVLEQLFASWGVEFASEWVWVKVTRTGEPVFELESVMRKPYEVLLLARRKIEKKMRKMAVPRKMRRGNGGETYRSSGESLVEPEEGIGQGLPRKVVVAVPDWHSRKPCIKDVIKPYLPAQFTACEIFGRHLTEGFFTWGDEAIKFNSSQYWTEQDD